VVASTLAERSGTTTPENDRTIIRYGALFGLAGTVLAFVGNALHPRTFEDSAIARFDLIADSGIWKFVHFFIGAALILLIGGLVAFDRRLNGRPGGGWARLGLVVGIVSVAIGVALVALDGWTMKTLADEWAAAGRTSTGPEFASLNTTEQIVNGLFSAFIGTLIGVTPLLLGIALYQSGVFPSWAGVLAVAAGVLGIAVDVVQSLGEIAVVTANVLFPLAAFGVTISLLVVNWMMFREASEPERLPQPSAAS
jgi:hypothetical protein